MAKDRYDKRVNFGKLDNTLKRPMDSLKKLGKK